MATPVPDDAPYPRWPDAPWVNTPVLFEHGPTVNGQPLWQNRWIRTELVMEQSSSLGRKSTPWLPCFRLSIERRPIGPPTFIVMNLYHVDYPVHIDPVTQAPQPPPPGCPETLLPVEEIMGPTWICMTSLFRIHAPTREHSLGRVWTSDPDEHPSSSSSAAITTEKPCLGSKRAVYPQRKPSDSPSSAASASPSGLDDDPTDDPQDPEFDTISRLAYPYPATALPSTAPSWPLAIQEARQHARQSLPPPRPPSSSTPLGDGPLPVGTDLDPDEMTLVEKFLPREPLRFVRARDGSIDDLRSRLGGEQREIGCQILDRIQGTKGYVFIWNDILIHEVGYWAVRFHVINLGWKTYPSYGQAGYFPVLADVFSSPIAVYPNKEFPGLPPISDLMNHYGMQTRVRKREKDVAQRTAGEPRRVKAEKQPSKPRARAEQNRKIKQGSADDEAGVPEPTPAPRRGRKIPGAKGITILPTREKVAVARQGTNAGNNLPSLPDLMPPPASSEQAKTELWTSSTSAAFTEALRSGSSHGRSSIEHSPTSPRSRRAGAPLRPSPRSAPYPIQRSPPRFGQVPLQSPMSATAPFPSPVSLPPSSFSESSQPASASLSPGARMYAAYTKSGSTLSPRQQQATMTVTTTTGGHTSMILTPLIYPPQPPRSLIYSPPVHPPPSGSNQTVVSSLRSSQPAHTQSQSHKQPSQTTPPASMYSHYTPAPHSDYTSSMQHMSPSMTYTEGTGTPSSYMSYFPYSHAFSGTAPTGPGTSAAGSSAMLPSPAPHTQGQGSSQGTFGGYPTGTTASSMSYPDNRASQVDYSQSPLRYLHLSPHPPPPQQQQQQQHSGLSSSPTNPYFSTTYPHHSMQLATAPLSSPLHPDSYSPPSSMLPSPPSYFPIQSASSTSSSSASSSSGHQQQQQQQRPDARGYPTAMTGGWGVARYELSPQQPDQQQQQQQSQQQQR